MPRHKELSRFTASGKTFFFNHGRAKNGTDYLAINAIYGRGNQERIVLFSSHYMEFYKHLIDAIGELSGLTPTQKELEDPSALPPWRTKCPKCGDDDFAVDINAPEWREWAIVCKECDTVVLSTPDYVENG